MSLSIIEPKPDLVREQGERLAEGELRQVDLFGRAVPVLRTPAGLRAVSTGKPTTRKGREVPRSQVRRAPQASAAGHGGAGGSL